MAAVADDAKTGLDPLFDPEFLLDDEQKDLRQQLIEICEKEIRPRADHNDLTLTFPRESLEALGPLLGLLVPKERGGLGQNHTCSPRCETIARYGGASAAMCYTMHIGAVARPAPPSRQATIQPTYLSRVDKDVLIGTLSYSDPETGSHFWYPMSSGREGERRLACHARRPPGRRPAASPTGTSSRPPPGLRRQLLPTSPAG